MLLIPRPLSSTTVQIIGTPDTREDGLLIDSTQNAVIERLRYEGYGIGLCFASGDADEGREVNAPTSDILVRDMELVHGDGMVFTSAMAGGYRNITLRNILLDGSAHRGSGKMMRGMRLKAKAKVSPQTVTPLSPLLSSSPLPPHPFPISHPWEYSGQQ